MISATPVVSPASRVLCAGMIVLMLFGRSLAQPASTTQNQGFAPPPRSIADITAILDSEKPDPTKYGRYIALADQQPPAGASNDTLGGFYLNRAIAASQIGRVQQWLADAKKALELKPYTNAVFAELFNASLQMGNFTDALRYIEQAMAANSTSIGVLIGGRAYLASGYAKAGQLNEAEAQVGRARAGFDTMRANPRAAGGSTIDTYNAEANLAAAAGDVRAAEGRLADAEREYARSVLLTDQLIKDYDSWVVPNKPSLENKVSLTVTRRLAHASAVALQGRLAEAESIARTALLIGLKQGGRYSPATALAVGGLAAVIIEEGRSAEARRLAEAALDIHLRIGSLTGATGVRLTIGNTLAVEGKWREAMAMFDEANKSVQPGDQLARAAYDRDLNHIMAELKTGRADAALAEITNRAQTLTKLLGESHPDALEAEGLRAATLATSGRRDEALAAFRAVVPRLIQSSRTSDSGGNSPLLRDMRLRFILETYIDLLAQTKAPASAAEAFALADVIRGQTVQHALSESAARVSVRDPALADLVRREQDARSQINALFALIASIQAAPADQHDDKAAAALRAQVDQLRAARAKLREEIEKRFPDYANLIDPRPADIEQVRKVLRPDEAMVTFYLGENRSFVWAVPASGTPAFASAALSAAQVAAEVQVLRRALEPNASTLAEIPAFDTERAYRLYAVLLQPVESGWRSAKSLLVVPHGALGELPLALLPTAAGKPRAAGGLPFAEYQKVPWLVRQVAVTQLPSATSLVTLRTLPPGNANRRAFLGFGDPWFNEAEAKEAQSQGGAGTVIASRGAGGKGLHIVLRAAPKTETAATATVASLPRLPETADEVRNVAIALKADPAADVFLGAKANEETVRTADLAHRRVVMFATHGLVPGDLDGLQEPALALSAPGVAHVQGDGLLTMSKILGLKLDADWVVLSACNTAAGSGAGAEAVSGLGRAFFYAGTRALLVSNWPVETISARTLTTDLFLRQAEQPGLSRAEALRQAELALIDGPGFSADGKPLFSYAHPIFWAPFAVIGDGG